MAKAKESPTPFGLLERVKGIEPSYPAWEAGALPLSNTRIFFSEEKNIEAAFQAAYLSGQSYNLQ
jgi:hypothetical protein